MEKKFFKIVSAVLVAALLAAPWSFGAALTGTDEAEVASPAPAASANDALGVPPFFPGGVTPGGIAPGALLPLFKPDEPPPPAVVERALPADRAASPGAITPGAVTVSDFKSFEAAVKDDSVKEIVIDADITIERKIEATRNNDLTIRGADKSILLIEDEKLPANALDFTMTFRGNYKNITFSAIEIHGHSYGASVNAPVRGARVVFDNVRYIGPALYHGVVEGNTGVIKDSAITLRVRNEKVRYTSEAMHAFNVELVGDVRITKEEESGEDYDEIFYFSLPEGDLIVAENADIKIANLSKAAGSAYWSGLLFIEGGNANKHSFVVKDGARFSYDGVGGCVLEQWPLDKFTIGKKAEVNMRLSVPGGKSMFRRDDNGAYFRAKDIVLAEGAVWNYILRGDAGERRDALLGAENLTVGEGAVLRAKAPENVKGEDLLRFYGKKPRVTLNKPKEVLLYNGARTSTPVSAISAAQAGDGYGVSAAGPIELDFMGKGIRAWDVGKEKIGIDDNWKVDTAAAHGEWGVPAAQGHLFTLTAAVGGDGALIHPNSKPHAGSAPPNPDPADPQRGLKSFANKSVIQFDGEGHIIDAPDAAEPESGANNGASTGKPGAGASNGGSAGKPEAGTSADNGVPAGKPEAEIAKPQPSAPPSAPDSLVVKPTETAPDAGKGGEAKKPGNASGGSSHSGGGGGDGGGGGSYFKPGAGSGGASTAKPGAGGASSLKPGKPGSASAGKPGNGALTGEKPKDEGSKENPPSPPPHKGGLAAGPEDEKLATPGGIRGGVSGGKPDDGAGDAGPRSDAGDRKADSRGRSASGSRIERGGGEGAYFTGNAAGAGLRGHAKRSQGANARESRPEKPGAPHGLFGAPKAEQGDAWALLNLLIAILCSILTAAAAIRLARSRGDESECEADEKRCTALQRLGMLAGVSAPIAFLLTENMSGSMVAVDRWTLLMAAIFAAQALLMAAAGIRGETWDEKA
ncbi:MAG: hypothetical protein LBP30_05985 [Clostridiales Family XIII bacterium]|jgi:hypothetical protein|nr:hypothetical protein [Clostridiales Family XIII bacterium]